MACYMFFLIGIFSQRLTFFASLFILSEKQKNALYNINRKKKTNINVNFYKRKYKNMVRCIRLTLAPNLLFKLFSVLYHDVWHALAEIKACVCDFYQIFIFSPNDSPLKIMKNAFYFIKKALFVLEIFEFL